MFYKLLISLFVVYFHERKHRNQPIQQRCFHLNQPNLRLQETTRLYALQQPPNKSFDQMDVFDKMDAFIFEKEFKKVDKMLIKIFEHNNPGFTLVNGTRVEKTSISDYKKSPDILKVNWQKVIEQEDDKTIFNRLKGIVPRAPETKEEIEEDSFEGYLLSEFEKIVDSSDEINFEQFYQWKIKMGLVLTKLEVMEVYVAVLGGMKPCSIMDFITINKIIDEGNAADYTNYGDDSY